jgi:hypothetical protein
VNNTAIGLGARGGGCYGAYINNCIIWYNTAEQIGDDVSQPLEVNSSCIPGYIGASSPSFIGGGDYHLSGTSICVDGGSNELAGAMTDLDGIPLPLDGDTNGTAVVDIGCYEFIHAAADSDADGLADTDELDVFGTDPTNANSDGDPMDDGDEYIADTDPNDPNDWFRINAVSNNSPVTVYFESSLLRNYTLLGRTNLTAGAWQPLIGPRAGNPGPGGYDQMTNDESSPAKFYKLTVELP